MRKATFWRRKDVADARCKPLNKERSEFRFSQENITMGQICFFLTCLPSCPVCPRGQGLSPPPQWLVLSITILVSRILSYLSPSLLAGYCPIYHHPCQQDIILSITILVSRTMSYLSPSLLAGQSSNDLTSIIVSCCRGSMKLLMPQATPSIKLQFITLLQGKVNIMVCGEKQDHLR